MAFFDKVKEKAAKGLDKAKDLGDQAKMTVQKEREQGKIKSAYAVIGKKIAEEHPELVKEFCPDQAEIIEAAKAAIVKIEEELADKKEAVEEKVEAAAEKVEEVAEAAAEKAEEVVEAAKAE